MKPKAHVVGEGKVPKNKLQEVAFRNGIMTSYQFAQAMVAKGIMSHGASIDKWNSGRAGNTSYRTLLAVTKFFGADRIEEVFTP